MMKTFATTFYHNFRVYMGNHGGDHYPFFRTRMGVEGSHTPEDPRLHMRPVEAGRKMEWAAYVEELLGECQHMSTVRS